MAQAILEFGFTRDKQVLVTDGVPSGSRGSVPHSIIYPFVMAGKLMFNFPPAEIASVARQAARYVGSLEGRPDDGVSLFGGMSRGYQWAPASARASKRVSARFSDSPDGWLICATDVPWLNSEEYHRAAIDAALDYARHSSLGQGMRVVEGASVFFEAFGSNAVPNPAVAIMLATAAAMHAAGIDLGSRAD